MFPTFSKFSFFSFIPFSILGILTIISYLTGSIPISYLVFSFCGWLLFDGLGVAVGYHRVFAHKTHPLPTWKEVILLLLGLFSGQGSSIAWVAIHRGYHHAYADRYEDLHSPIHGKWSAFFAWTLKLKDGSVRMKFASDLMRKKHHVWFHFHGWKLLWSVLAITFLFNWRFALSIFCLPAALSIWNESLINVYGHNKSPGSYRNFDTNDLSVNQPLFGYLGWGHGWHNNHHAYPNSFDFGYAISAKWWELDPCRLFLFLL